MLDAKSQDRFDQIADLRRWLETGLIERLLIGVLTGGLLLIEGPPGLAKTRAAKLLASALNGTFARVQCKTARSRKPLLPADRRWRRARATR